MSLCALRLRRALSSLSRANRCLCSPVHVAPEAPAPAPRSSLSSTMFSPSRIQLRLFRSSPMSLMSNQSRYSNINDADKIDPDTILFEGCDYNHWLITMDFPKDPKPTPEEMVRTYEETCAKGLKISVEEAKQRMYACSTTTYQGFQAVMTEAESEQFRGVPGVVFILPDSYIDPQNKEYGGDKYENGFITPRPPPVQYRRQGGGGGYNRNRNNFDQPRFDRQGGGGGMPNRQGNPQQYGGPPSSYPSQQNYGPPPNYPQQQNQGAPPMHRDASNPGQPRPNYPPQENFRQPPARDTVPMTNYPPPGRDGFQGNYNQMRQNPNPNNYYNQERRDMPPVPNNYSGNNLNYSPPAAGGPVGQNPNGGGFNGQATAGPYGQGGNAGPYGQGGNAGTYSQGSGSYGQGGYSAQGEPQRSFQAEERNDASGAEAGTYQRRY